MYLVQSNFGVNFGNFEAVFDEGDRLVHYWRKNHHGAFPWYKSVEFGDTIGSVPALIQSNFGKQGDFEVVVREGNKLRHYWRDNDDPTFPWNKGVLFGDNVGSAPALIQSSLGKKGNFEVVVREGNELCHYWRDNDDPNLPWNKEAIFGHDVSSAPALIQSNVGSKVNLEVVVGEGDKLRHYWREIGGTMWNKGLLFGDHVDSAPALIQSNLGSQGNFEVVVKRGDTLQRYFRDHDDPGYPWHKEETLSDIIRYPPALIQSSFGAKGNFEVLTKRGRCIVHFWRNNDIPGFPWSDEILMHAVVPSGELPTKKEKKGLVDLAPKLENFLVTDGEKKNPKLDKYNCFAWSLGFTNICIDLAPGSKKNGDLSIFDIFYKQYGWKISAHGRREYKKRKIALYADPIKVKSLAIVRHASRETYDCDWHESKCGAKERIIHDKFQLEGANWGIIVRYYEQEDPNANLDLEP